MLRRGLAALVMFGASGAGALAADLDLPPLAPMLGAGPRWEGVSFGVYATSLWAPSQSSTQSWWPTPSTNLNPLPYLVWDAPGAFNSSAEGVGAGVQIGYDKQFGSIVVGGVADYGLLGGAKSSRSFAGDFYSDYVEFPTGSYTSTFSQSLNSLGSVRAKLGYAIGSDWLVYGTAGLAFGQTTISNNVNLPGGDNARSSRNALSVGSIYGAGVQYALGSNWSLGLEGLAYNLGSAPSVSIANFYTYAILPTGNVTLPESVHVDNRTSFQGYELRLTAAYTFGGQVSEPSYGPSTDPNTEIPITIGMREGLSMGQSQMTLYDNGLLSRLTYKGTANLTAEPYLQMEVPDWNVYVSGYAGIGTQGGGNLQDEDFPPAITPYSSTNSSLKDGSLQYGVLDVGYNALAADWYKVGAFLGYTFEADAFNAFGCAQTAPQIAGNPYSCEPGLVTSSNMVISDSYSWSAARVGLSGSVLLPNGVTLSGDAAWLPLIGFTGSNYHYLRMPYGFNTAIPSSGSGAAGFQLAAMADYKITPNFDIGAGVRYWSLAANGSLNEQAANPALSPVSASFSSQRIQAFVQSGYHF